TIILFFYSASTISLYFFSCFRISGIMYPPYDVLPGSVMKSYYILYFNVIKDLKQLKTGFKN
ncbi:MAG: hypothetical protein WBJ82_10295, partial [Tepidanaerobacteraceae bacterium]